MWVGLEKVKNSIPQSVAHAKLISLWLVRVRAKSHMNSATHKANTPPASGSNQTVRPQPVVVVDEVTVPQPQQQQTITGSLLKENVTKAEIMRALDTVLCHYSYRSADSKKKLFAGMFPDSEIAQSVAFGKTKINYMVTYGIAPYFKELLLSTLNSCPWYTPFPSTRVTTQLQRNHKWISLSGIGMLAKTG